jgi:hypothetical protein
VRGAEAGHHAEVGVDEVAVEFGGGVGAATKSAGAAVRGGKPELFGEGRSGRSQIVK